MKAKVIEVFRYDPLGEYASAFVAKGLGITPSQAQSLCRQLKREGVLEMVRRPGLRGGLKLYYRWKKERERVITN